MTMSELQATYESILESINVQQPACNRRALKRLIQVSIPDVEFHQAEKVNESDRVSIKKTRDAAMNLAEKENNDDPEEMKLLFKAALLLRKAINNCKKWEFTGSFEEMSIYTNNCISLDTRTEHPTNGRKEVVDSP